jgi:hypothetical protein
VIIVEGILVLHIPEIRDQLHMKIYVDTGEGGGVPGGVPFRGHGWGGGCPWGCPFSWTRVGGGVPFRGHGWGGVSLGVSLFVDTGGGGGVPFPPFSCHA